jgi:hypothetical protein
MGGVLFKIVFFYVILKKKKIIYFVRTYKFFFLFTKKTPAHQGPRFSINLDVRSILSKQSKF